MKTHKFEVRVLLFQENNTWVAQCLEYDFATQGKTTLMALDAFERAFVGQIVLDIKSKQEPLLDIGRAPKEYFDLFDGALQLKEKRTFPFLEDGFRHPIQASTADLRIVA